MRTARRLLAVAGVFPPFGGPGAVRMVKLFKHLPRHGWEVDVIAPGGRAGWYPDQSLAAELGSTTVVRVGRTTAASTLATRVRTLAKDHNAQAPWLQALRLAMRPARRLRDTVSIPDEYLLWATAAWRRGGALARARPYDALFTSSFPYSVHLAGLAIARQTGLPWVVELRDPWRGNSFRRQTRPWRLRLDGWLEALVLSCAREIVALTPGTLSALAGRYPAEIKTKLHLITNGFDPDDYGAAPAPTPGKPLQLLYVGTFEQPLQPPDTFLAALGAMLSARPAIADAVELRVLGGADLASGAQIGAWRDAHPATSMLTLQPFVPHLEATAAMLAADALVLSVAAGAAWVLTSKVFEYLGSGRPIVAVVPDGDCRDLLTRCGGATLFYPGDVAGLAAYLLRAIDDGHRLPTPPQNAQAVRALAWPELAANLAGILDQATRS
ncbi:MAG: glycosyltransferase [Deltaproteobacteria bacterium]|nr:glycosyltransferase [Deltaproteobacteria bacterium]